jgi:hypothetical protein
MGQRYGSGRLRGERKKPRGGAGRRCGRPGGDGAAGAYTAYPPYDTMAARDATFHGGKSVA